MTEEEQIALFCKIFIGGGAIDQVQDGIYEHFYWDSKNEKIPIRRKIEMIVEGAMLVIQQLQKDLWELGGNPYHLKGGIGER